MNIFTFLFKKVIEQVTYCHDAKFKELKKVNKKTDFDINCSKFAPNAKGYGLGEGVQLHLQVTSGFAATHCSVSFQWEVTMETQNIYFSTPTAVSYTL